MPHYVDALADAGWSVDVCAPYPFYPSWKIDRSLPRISHEHDGAIRVTRYAPFVPRHYSTLGRGLHEASIALNALRLLRSRAAAADLIVATSPPVLGAACAVRVARYVGKPSLVVAYDLVADLASDAYGRLGRVAALALRRVESSLYARAGSVIALTDDMARRIDHLSRRSGPVPVIRIWADDELLGLDHTAAARACRARLGIPEDRCLVGFAGSFGRKQCLPELVEAMRGLPPGFTTVFIGEGPERRDMERLARQGPGDVRILPPQATPDLHAFLSACDVSIVVAWTQHAGSLFPSKVANILAAGSPVLAITHRDTELATLLEREDIGITCSSVKPDQIREAVRRGVALGRDGDWRARCRRYAARHLERRHAMDRFVHEVGRLA